MTYTLQLVNIVYLVNRINYLLKYVNILQLLCWCFGSVSPLSKMMVSNQAEPKLYYLQGDQKKRKLLFFCYSSGRYAFYIWSTSSVTPMWDHLSCTSVLRAITLYWYPGSFISGTIELRLFFHWFPECLELFTWTSEGCSSYAKFKEARRSIIVSWLIFFNSPRYPIVNG